MHDLEADLHELAAVPILLVASDFDGTLAPIVDDPDRVHPDADSLATLRTLASAPRTHSAIISGRSLAHLISHVGSYGKIHLIGSHGAECSHGPTPAPPVPSMAALQRATEQAERIANGAAGCLVEKKPAGFAFHYRKAEAAAAARAVDALLAAATQWPELHIRHGKKVVELSAVHADKGNAVGTLRTRVAADALLVTTSPTRMYSAHSALRM